jgi:type I restriction enzyme, R subunit
MRMNEENLIERYLIEELQKPHVGTKVWTYVPGKELGREDQREPLDLVRLRTAIRRLNPDASDADVDEVIVDLQAVPTNSEGIRTMLRYFKEGVPKRLANGRTTNVQLFDYETLENEYVVTNQNWYRGSEPIRTDIMLYVNGIPLIDIETKDPSKPGTWYDAYKQIKRYETSVPEYTKYVQLGVAADAKVKYFPIVPQDTPRTEEWKEDDLSPVDAIVRMLAPERLLDFIKYFVFTATIAKKHTKVAARYMQYRAVNRIVDRVTGNLNGETEKNKGLIWHWQGSGKTYEMIFAANKLYQLGALENPTILFIIDRRDLETQLEEEAAALDLHAQPEIIASIESLKRFIRHDDYRGRRGLNIALIHKFQPEEIQPVLRELGEREHSIRTRRNVIALIDEGHRTQSGKLADIMRSVVQNGFVFAFTGTPIARKGVDTYRDFSYPDDEELYLDRYFITDSIKDGFTRPIVYEPRLDSSAHLKREQLEAFLELEEDEIPEEHREQVKDEVRKRIDLVKAYLEGPERIRMICEDIAEHYKNSVQGRFKAIVVAVSREACVTYKRILDELLPGEAEVVMSHMPSDPERLRTFRDELGTRYPGLSTEEINEEIVRRYKRTDEPRILIVTGMLLTGFDAPQLQTMYLDKPLKDHGLLQAIARTNRPHEAKAVGLVIDYVGVLKHLREALSRYADEDYEGVAESIDDLLPDFTELLERLIIALEEYDPNTSRESIVNAIRRLSGDSELADRFVEEYRQLRRLFELLPGDSLETHEYVKYRWLSAVYTWYSKELIQDEAEQYVEKYYDRTVKMIHKSTELEGLDRLAAVTLDESYIEKVQALPTEHERAANLVFAVNRYRNSLRQQGGLSEDLIEKIDRLLADWRDRSKDYEEQYRESLEVWDELREYEEHRRQIGFDRREYAVYEDFKNRNVPEPAALEAVRSLTTALKPYLEGNWTALPTSRTAVRRIIRETLIDLIAKKHLAYEHLEPLYESIKERLEGSR